LNTLKSDLVRVNRTISVEREKVNKGISNLKLLSKERERILEDCLGECDGKS